MEEMHGPRFGMSSRGAVRFIIADFFPIRIVKNEEY
jgi:hypothetical protein